MGRRIRIFDTTLRDGEQTPGVNMNISDKLRIAHVLAGLGVDVIEAGFPASSRDDFMAVRRISEQVKGPVVCALARAEEGDVRRAAEALERRRPLAETVGRQPFLLRWAGYYALLLGILFFGVFSATPFIYGQF